jgi:protein-disulfide isomerase
VLVEYGDYECPDCAVASVVVDHLKEIFGDRICFVFRHFPVTQIHSHALPAAELAEAAAIVGRFWEVHSILFKHQDALAERDLLRYADWLAMDNDSLADALTIHAYKNRVREDFTSGVRSGVNGTPTFFLNGARYDGPTDLHPMLMTIQQIMAPHMQLQRLHQR